ncbi:MAG: alpha/beta hydrolase [Flavobacteriales bacterium]|nr:alpha/beta hydrolase [Flavobacteriales bacterium]
MTVTFRNAPVFFTEKGTGPALVLLHGFLEDSTIYGPIAERLSAHFRTVLIDLPGHGSSGILGYVHPMHDMADAVKAVLDHLNIEDCVLIGHSMGGYVTLAFAERYPEMLRAIGLFHSTAIADSEAKIADRQRAIDLMMRNAGAFISASIPGLAAEGARERLHDEIATLVEHVCTFSRQGIVANIRGMMQRPDRTRVLRNLHIPALFIHGSEDPIIPTASIRQQAALVGDHTFVELEGVGHLGYLEAPDLCINAIRNFAEKAYKHGRATAHF